MAPDTTKIYYPGFTFGGAAEPLGALVLVALLVVSPPAGNRYWLVLAALAGLIGMQVVYWLVTHPVNGVWTRGLQLSGFGASFFSAFTGDAGGDWQRLRDIWEYSHVVRAGFGMLSFLCLAMAIVA